MSLRCFKPREGVEFCIPTDWWAEAGMEGFERRSDSYHFVASPEVSLIRLDNIACPPLDVRRRPDLQGGFNRDRMIDVLRGIASQAIMPPISILERLQGAYSRTVNDGYHRFYASLAAGFSHIPTKLGWMPDPET
jgi:hypothetical protein